MWVLESKRSNVINMWYMILVKWYAMLPTIYSYLTDYVPHHYQCFWQCCSVSILGIRLRVDKQLQLDECVGTICMPNTRIIHTTTNTITCTVYQHWWSRRHVDHIYSWFCMVLRHIEDLLSERVQSFVNLTHVYTRLTEYIYLHLDTVLCLEGAYVDHFHWWFCLVWFTLRFFQLINFVKV